MNEDLWNVKTRLDSNYLLGSKKYNDKALFYAQTYLDLISDEPELVMLGVCNSQAYSNVLQTAWDDLPHEFKINVAQLSKISVKVALGLLVHLDNQSHQKALCEAMRTKENDWRDALILCLDSGEVDLSTIPTRWLEETVVSMSESEA